MGWTPLPIGIENYAEMIEKGYYYVDKTLFIKELLDRKGKVNLFTRPRRFGKTLNMSMLQYFFEKSERDHTPLFTGTKIMQAGEKAEFKRHLELLRQLPLKEDFDKCRRFAAGKAEDTEYLTALRFLSECLSVICKTKAVILIDEYDVPLENAYFRGFYDRMAGLIRSLFESALKTNNTLEFAVITGCLRISKESIFTGLNNLNIISIMDNSYAEHFGFTQEEVDAMLSFYHLESKRDSVKDWYDGYQFGDTEVYNPWSVICYVDSCYKNPDALFKPYWSNTSSNSIVRTLVDRADLSVRQEIESLIAGHTIFKPVHEDITYEDMDSTQDHLWNFLFFTGYLKKIRQIQQEEDIFVEMSIPNIEVRYIYKNTVLRWFEESVKKKNLSPLYDSILSGRRDQMADILSENLMETISFYDYQESYYHGFLAGLLKNMENYIVLSNRESGSGHPDILLKYPSVRGKAVIIEIKIAKSYQELPGKCDEALRQIEERQYEASLRQEGYQDILKYGIAFYRKECMVK